MTGMRIKLFQYSSGCEMWTWTIFTQERYSYSLCFWKPVWAAELVWELWDELCCAGTGAALPCVRSCRVRTSSRTLSCRTCCKMCCLWPSCMMPILSSFLSVSLMRARPEEKSKTRPWRLRAAARGNSIHTAEASVHRVEQKHKERGQTID